MGESGWYVVQTKPRQEDRVQRWLQERGGFPVFLPRIEDRRRRRSGCVTVVEPLFPSYLFVQMTLRPERWSAVRWTPGVRRVVGVGEMPTPVPPEAIRILMDRCASGDVIRWRPWFQPGAAIRVVHGPFAGLEGILERPTSQSERVRVLLRLLGSVTPVEMDITDIELAS